MFLNNMLSVPRFGRRTALVLTSVAPAVVGVIRAFSTSYIMYLCFEFLEAVVGAGVYSTAFVLGMLLCGTG